MKIYVERGKRLRPSLFEVVERKGTGHPDTLCDAVAEEISIQLSKYYLENFGFILHHNVDKVTLAAGRSSPSFGGGRVLKPMKLLIVGRATTEVGKSKVPIDEIVERSLSKVFGTLRNVKREHYTYNTFIGEGSTDLKNVVEKKGHVPLSNDTSVGVAHAPLSNTEKIVLAVEEALNSESYKEKHPEVGEDIKVMGVRTEDVLNVTVAAAFVDRYVTSPEDYLEKKESVREDVERLVERMWDGEFHVGVNTADIPDENSFYLTVTGLSAENGDDGAVGRGNRQVGLIPATRPVSLEAVAGKNPVSHVGKIYNVVARLIAEDIVEEGADEVSVFLVSKIGYPITEPQFVGIELLGNVPEERIRQIVDYRLSSIPDMVEDFVKGALRLF